MSPPYRVVLILPDPPLSFGNAASRWFYASIKDLGRRKRDFCVFYPYHDDSTPGKVLKELPGIDLRPCKTPAKRSILASLRSKLIPTPNLYSRDDADSIRKELTKGFTLALFETHYPGWLPHLPTRQKTLLNLHSLYLADLPDYSGVVSQIHKVRILISEKVLLSRHKHISAISDEILTKVKELRPRVNHYRTRVSIDTTVYKKGRQSSLHPTIGIIGSFNWYPTFSAGEELLVKFWPRIKAALPECRLLIVGREASLLKRYFPKDTSSFIFAENVADIFPYFHQLDVMFYMPKRGSGVKIKILEALAMGIPVVTNQFGAEGLDGALILPENDNACIKESIRLLTDADYYKAQADRGLAALDSSLSVDRAVDTLEETIQKIMHS